MGQLLFAPPNVKGWVGGKAWLNSATVLARQNFAEAMLGGTVAPPPAPPPPDDGTAATPVFDTVPPAAKPAPLPPDNALVELVRKANAATRPKPSICLPRFPARRCSARRPQEANRVRCCQRSQGCRTRQANSRDRPCPDDYGGVHVGVTRPLKERTDPCCLV